MKVSLVSQPYVVVMFTMICRRERDLNKFIILVGFYITLNVIYFLHIFSGFPAIYNTIFYCYITILYLYLYICMSKCIRLCESVL